MSKARSTKSSGNVFADIGVPGAEEHLAKANLVIGIAAIIRSKGLLRRPQPNWSVLHSPICHG
jgi:hypothetical protein